MMTHSPQIPRYAQTAEVERRELLPENFDDLKGTVALAIREIHEGWQQPLPAAD